MSTGYSTPAFANSENSQPGFEAGGDLFGADGGGAPPAREDDDGMDEEEEAIDGKPPQVLRCDVARGMERGETAAICLDMTHDAPLWVVAFPLDDPTAMPRLAVEAIWALNNLRSFIERGTAEGVYLEAGVPGFTLHRQPKRKHVLRREADKSSLSEFTIQGRVHELRGRDDACERYLLLVVRYPIAFSLRLAVYLSLEGRGVDERAAVWSKLALHVRSGVPPYKRPEALLRMYDESLDWMRSSDVDGFTCLFSAQMAADWMRVHFGRRHRGAGCTLEGLHDPLDVPLVDPVFVDQCAGFDADVQSRVVVEKKKAENKRRRAAGNDDDAAAAAAAAAAPDAAPPPKAMKTVDPLLLLDGVSGGLPESVATIEIITPTRQEQPPTMVDFSRQMRAFPESVMLVLLRGAMSLPTELMDTMAARMRAEGLALTMTEVRDVILGSAEYQLGRQMLCLGDEGWSRHMMAMLASVPEATRLGMLRDFVRVGFALAFTRATGSDGYTDDRVGAYGRYMLFEDGALSRRDCRTLYTQTGQAFPGKIPASATHRAWEMAMELLLACDRRVWNLRPDNLFLFMELLIGDIMLCLNFFGSVIDGAFNGIGGTAVVRDGGGSYRVRFMDRGSGGRGEGDVMSKNNSSGADHTTNCLKQGIDIGEYEPRFKPEREVMMELKRVTETSLIQETCNVLEGHGSELRLKHAITHTGDRKYSTEMKTGGDQQSDNCMSAIAWLIPRNTRARTANGFQTTREDEKTKERVRVEYRQVKGGYLLLCSNNVKQGARERFHTMLAVSRSVASAAAGVEVGYAAALEGANNKQRMALDGRVDRMTQGGNQGLDGIGRGLFFNGLGTAIFAGFMQWTGMLGQIREARTATALLVTFDAHLELCHDLLNPAMSTNSDRARFREISKSRGVAASLLGISMRETIEAGRRNETQQMAVERTCIAFKAEGCSAAIAWIMGDMLEHMLRLDFFVIMLVLAKKLRVPVVSLNALLAWLDSGNAADCPQAQAYLDAVPVSFHLMPAYATDAAGADLTPVGECLYITTQSVDKSMEVSKLDTPFSPEVRTRFCEAMGKRLRKEFSTQLLDCCQVKDSEVGDDVVRGMLEHSIDRQFAWPSLLMARGIPKSFWMGRRAPGPPLTLAPLRMILTEMTTARLAADLRWLLLVNSLGQGLITQSSRFAIVGQLVQRFYQHCVPRQMAVSGRDLFVGLPTQVVGAGFVWPPLLPSERRTLRRPGRDIGTDAPGCPTGMIEDLGVAAPRYELAAMLGVRERELPTDCVHYDFPGGVWTPCLLFPRRGDDEIDDRVDFEQDGEPVAVMWDGGRFYMQRERDAAAGVRHDISPQPLRAQEEEGYLGGRVTRNVRPVCAFYRPGTVVRVSPTAWGGVGEMRAGVYEILPARTRMTAREVEDTVLKPDARVWVRASALPPGTRFVDDGGVDDPGAYVVGAFESVYTEDVPPGSFALRLKRAGLAPPVEMLFGASHGEHAFRECSLRNAPMMVLPVEALCPEPPVGARVWSTLL